MTVLKIIGIVLLVFLLLSMVRIGAVVLFGETLCVRLRVGLFRVTVYPKKKEEKPEPEAEKPKEKAEGRKPRGKRRGMPKPSFEELLDLIQTMLGALGAGVRRACRRVRIDPMDVTVVFGGSDPADTATLYGMASAAMYALMPRMEETFCIPHPSLHLRVDFDAAATRAEGTVGVSLRVCDLFAIALSLTLPLLRWYLRFKRAHKHDIPARKKSEAVETDSKIVTEDKIA